jgi:hypothetical protein
VCGIPVLGVELSLDISALTKRVNYSGILGLEHVQAGREIKLPVTTPAAFTVCATHSMLQNLLVDFPFLLQQLFPKAATLL